MKWIKNRALLHGIALWIPLVITSAATYAQDNTAPSANGTSTPKRMSDADWAAGMDLLQSAQHDDDGQVWQQRPALRLGADALG